MQAVSPLIGCGLTRNSIFPPTHRGVSIQVGLPPRRIRMMDQPPTVAKTPTPNDTTETNTMFPKVGPFQFDGLKICATSFNLKLENDATA
jgi:hypothetical protein